ERTLVTAEPHGRSLVDDLLLLLHHVDDGVLWIGFKLGAVRALQLEDVPRELDHRNLQPEAETVIGNLVLARVTRRCDLALGASVADSAWHQDAFESLQSRQSALLLQILGVEAHDVD